MVCMGPCADTVNRLRWCIQTSDAVGPRTQTWPAAAAWAWKSPWLQVAAQVSAQHGSAAAWSPESNMAPGDSPEPRHLHSLQWEQEP